MVTYDFSKDTLLPAERKMLRKLKRIKTANQDFFGKYFYNLYESGYIDEHRIYDDDPFMPPEKDGTFCLTEKYQRYCEYRRNQFFHSSLWAGIISAIVSTIMSLIIAA